MLRSCVHDQLHRDRVSHSSSIGLTHENCRMILVKQRVAACGCFEILFTQNSAHLFLLAASAPCTLCNAQSLMGMGKHSTHRNRNRSCAYAQSNLSFTFALDWHIIPLCDRFCVRRVELRYVSTCTYRTVCIMYNTV